MQTDIAQLIASNLETRYVPARRGVLVRTSPFAHSFTPMITFTAGGYLGINIEDLVSRDEGFLALDNSSATVPEITRPQIILEFNWPQMDPQLPRPSIHSKTSIRIMTRFRLAYAAAALVMQTFLKDNLRCPLRYGDDIGPAVQHSDLFLLGLIPVTPGGRVWRPVLAWNKIAVHGQ